MLLLMLLLLFLCSVEDELFPDMVVLQEAPGQRERRKYKESVPKNNTEISVIQARSWRFRFSLFLPMQTLVLG